MTNLPSLSVITTTDPIANQLPLLLEALSELAMDQQQRYEVIIVDDLGQWQNSPPLHDRELPSLVIKRICPEQRQGQLKAIQRGLEEAQAPLILTIDPDLHPCVPEIPRMMAMINDDILAVHGVRGHRPDVGFFRLSASAIVNFFIRKITGLGVYDIGSPITLFDKKVLKMTYSHTQGKQPNLRLQSYLKLNGKLASYELQAHACKSSSSHYNLFRLIRISWDLLRDALYLRANEK